jgi:membrane protein
MPLAKLMHRPESLIARGRRLGSFIVYVARRFWNDDGLQIASALTYTTLLSMVPLLAVSLAVLSGFGAFDEVLQLVRGTLLDFFLPATAFQITEHIDMFLANAQRLTMPGVIALAVTAMLTLSTIEVTFSRIWRAEITRPWPLRVLVFWAVLTLGPLLIGTSLSITASVSDLPRRDAFGSIYEHVRFVVPLSIQWCAFTVLYLVVPARRVRLKHALIGGGVAALAFQPLKFGFAIFVSTADNYRVIYGALAAFPIFLLWLYAFWTLLLVGAHVTAALQERSVMKRLSPIVEKGPQQRLEAALALLDTLWRAAGTRTPVILEESEWRSSEPVLPQLKHAGLVAETDDGRMLAGCDYDRVPIFALWQALDLAVPDISKRHATETLQKLAAAEREILAHPLSSLFVEEGAMRTKAA